MNIPTIETHEGLVEGVKAHPYREPDITKYSRKGSVGLVEVDDPAVYECDCYNCFWAGVFPGVEIKGRYDLKPKCEYE